MYTVSVATQGGPKGLIWFRQIFFGGRGPFWRTLFDLQRGIFETYECVCTNVCVPRSKKMFAEGTLLEKKMKMRAGDIKSAQFFP